MASLEGTIPFRLLEKKPTVRFSEIESIDGGRCNDSDSAEASAKPRTPEILRAPKSGGILKNKSSSAAGQNGPSKKNLAWSHLAPSVSRDPDCVFAKLEIIALSAPNRYKVRQIEPSGFEDEIFEVNASDCFECNDDHSEEHLFEVGVLPHQSPPCVLHFLERHWRAGTIYISLTPLLIAINPFKNVGLDTDEIISQYRSVPDVETLKPHIFTIARRALDNYSMFQKSQIVIVSGESGAGKTEASKSILRFFAGTVRPNSDGSLDVQRALAAMNPVLEALGNAKTARNNNSSRFGRFVRLWLTQSGIEASEINTFFLEKTRVVERKPGEQNFHIFYKMLRGMNSAERCKFGFKNIEDYVILRNCVDSAELFTENDTVSWEAVKTAMKSGGLSRLEIEEAVKLWGAVLTVGNLEFVSNNRGAVIVKNRLELRDAANLLGMTQVAVEEELTGTRMLVGNAVLRKNFNEQEAAAQRDSFAKTIYEQLFKWFVARLNAAVIPNTSVAKSHFIGILDLFGSEICERNSFEQLLINIANEHLQKNFIDTVFDKELKIYREEGIYMKKLHFRSNKRIIDALTGPVPSLATVLEDSCSNSRSTTESFVQNCKRAFKDDNRVFKVVPKESNKHFVIAHSFADVDYDATGFLVKNSNVIEPGIVDLLRKSECALARGIVEGLRVERGKGQLIMSQFATQLQDLMTTTSSSEAHFIKCLKPNETNSSSAWIASKILNQLFCSSILEALNVKHIGFSWHRTFNDFRTLFRVLAVDAGINSTATSSEQAARGILQRSGLAADSDYQVGRSQVFLTPSAVKHLTARQRALLAQLSGNALLIESSCIKFGLREEEAVHLPSLVRFQARCREFLRGIHVGRR